MVLAIKGLAIRINDGPSELKQPNPFLFLHYSFFSYFYAKGDTLYRLSPVLFWMIRMTLPSQFLELSPVWNQPSLRCHLARLHQICTSCQHHTTRQDRMQQCRKMNLCGLVPQNLWSIGSGTDALLMECNSWHESNPCRGVQHTNLCRWWWRM